MLTILGQPAEAMTEAGYYRLTDARWPATKLHLLDGTLDNLSDLIGFKLKPEFKATWIEALRSGTWRQTTGHLAVEEGAGFKSYCCLGVYCMLRDVQVKDGRFEDGLCLIPFGDEQATTMLPSEVEDEVPALVQTILSQLNDGFWTFEQIAQFIEVAL